MATKLSTDFSHCWEETTLSCARFLPNIHLIPAMTSAPLTSWEQEVDLAKKQKRLKMKVSVRFTGGT